MEHVFEHMLLADAQYVLRECRRVLRPGGVLRISVPDCERYIRAYVDDPAWMLRSRAVPCRTRMEVLNDVFRQGFEHQYAYDAETLLLHLTDAGFVNAEAVGFGKGRLPELQIDKPDRQFESLYVEAVAP